MKNQLKMFTTTTMIICILLSVQSFALANENSERNLVEKAQTNVDEAAPDDWYTLARMSEKCIKRKVNLKEAVEWLDRSLSIKRSVYNLKIKGDYYAKLHLYKEAIKLYSESVILGILIDPNYRDAKTQYKTRELVIKLGGTYDGGF